MACGETIRVDYDMYVGMQLQLKNLKRQVADFESGAAYRRLEEANQRIRHYYERRIRALERDNAALSRQIRSNIDMWFDIFEEIQANCIERTASLERRLDEKDILLKEKEDQIARLKGDVVDKTREVVSEREAKIREEEKNQALKARLEQNSSNSSIPSSSESFRGKVTNNREKSGRKPGAQSGHKGHGRKKPAHVDESYFVEAPSEFTDGTRYYKLEEKQIHKMVVDIDVKVVVTDYYADVYRDRKTGARCHAPFPGGINLDVNYGENLKATIFLMKNHLNVSDEKIVEFIRDMTDGEIELSKGKVNEINREFSLKSKEEQDAIYARLADAKVLHVDMTNVRMNGELKNVVLCSDKGACMYSYREHKGDAGIEGTPAQVNSNLLVHDHDKTMYHYGSRHQECNEHHLRYLKAAIEAEEELTWHTKMRELLQEMNSTREKQDRKLRPEQIKDFEGKYDEILDMADQEYEDNPPKDWFRKGINLSREFREYRESVLRFLYDPDVDFTNNEAERCLRKVKRHMVVSGTFRGNTSHSAEEYCSGMSVLQTWRKSGEQPFRKAAEVFMRPWPERKKATPGDPDSAAVENCDQMTQGQ